MNDKVYKILLITGIVTDEHDPRVNGMLRRMLESTGRFEVKITEEFRGATAETLEGYDAVLLNYDGKKDVDAPYVGLGATAEKTIYDFVSSGKGIIIYHSAMIMGEPAFPEEYEKMVGGTFEFGKNGGRKNPKLAFTIDTVYGDPINEDMPSSWITAQDDLFINMKWREDCKVEVLATVYDGVEDYDPAKMQKHIAEIYKDTDVSKLENINQDHPVVWKNTYGKGRVFVPAIGHNADTIHRAPFVAMFCRGVEWACSGKVTIPYPDIQGAKRINGWPFYDNISIAKFAKMMEGK